MRDLEKNKRGVYQSHLIRVTPLKNEYNYETGSYLKEYSTPKFKKINYASTSIRPKNFSNEQWGLLVNHSILLSTSDTNFDIRPTDIFWIDKEVEYLENGVVDFDSANYVVGGIYNSLNTKIIGLDLKGVNSADI